jgi:hypothetical protein
MTTSIMIHSGLSRLSNYETGTTKYRDANQEALMITMLLAEVHLRFLCMVRRPKSHAKSLAHVG